MENLNGLVAVITGGGGGIGSATALEIAKQGGKIVLFGGHNEEKLKATKQLAEQVKGQAYIIKGDLTDDNFISNAVDEVIKKYGRIDILINNAGMAYSKAFEETPIEIYDKIMNLNVRVPYVLTQKVLPYLKKSDRASIINICSVVAHSGYPLQSAYTASKHALLGFTKSLASELYKDGIRVHAISPGGVYTDMVKIARPDLTPDGMIMPKDIADIVMFFLNNRNNAVVDEILVHRVNKQPFLV